MNSKISSENEIAGISRQLKKQGKIIVTTNGSFDILHSAHINLLEKAKQQGNILIVLVNSDDSIKKFKGASRPIIPQDERAYMLSALQSVDYVVIFNEDKPLKLLSLIKPEIHVKGGSFIQERIQEEQDLLSQWNGKFKNSFFNCFNLFFISISINFRIICRNVIKIKLVCCIRCKNYIWHNSFYLSCRQFNPYLKNNVFLQISYRSP